MQYHQPPTIGQQLEHDEGQAITRDGHVNGPIARLVGKYMPTIEHLLGFILDMSYEEATIVTCDAWKRKCGGVPKNSFVLIRLNPKAAAFSPDRAPRPSLILARVIEGVPTPVSKEIQQTIFEIHKIQAVIDPYTNAELQWGALKVAILGTYYDETGSDNGHDGEEIAFGNDIDSYVSPHFYEVYVPDAADLEVLINSFVSNANPVEIGVLRYTEAQTAPPRQPVRIRVAPSDFLCNRTALFGKTRSGKSNTIKQIAHMILSSGANVGQVIFDLAGEYDARGDQDAYSLYELHKDRCVRYSLNPMNRPTDNGNEAPRPLKVNFVKQVALGHRIIQSLWDSEHDSPPNYFLPFLEAWEPCDEDQLDERFPSKQDLSDKVRYLRAQSMYYAALHKAGFDLERDFKVRLHLTKEIRAELAKDPRIKNASEMPGRQDTNAPGLFDSLEDIQPPAGDTSTTEDDGAGSDDGSEAGNGTGDAPAGIADTQPIGIALLAYERLHELWTSSQSGNRLFPTSKHSGKPYFDEVHAALLRILGDRNVSGAKYLIPFKKYHSLSGSNLTADIKTLVDQGRTVIINLSNADEVVAGYFSQLVCSAIFVRQALKFADGLFEKDDSPYRNHSVLFYFEEAHNLFERDDKNLRSIYNRLAKEGAKFRIGLVYGTQSMTTLSPDLMKNTENFFIGHLNDDREVKEVTRHYEFRDVGPDVQRSKARGYVRMITLSHRFALPVQIRKFGSPAS